MMSLNRLRNLIVHKMTENNYTLEKTAEICDISYRQLCNILYGKSEDIYLSTFSKICESLNISYVNIFDRYSETEEEVFNRKIKELSISVGNKQYYLTEK